MFPFVRLIKDSWLASRQPPLTSLTDTHISQHICWPHDLDYWLEMTNGRALSLYDLGRMALAQRAGLIGVLRRKGWGLTMAGVSTRFRLRIRGFERYEMRSRALCWDDKFIYLEQSMWKRSGECASHVMYRSAVTDKNGLIPPQRVLAALGQPQRSPPMPDWVAAWCAAEATRPWPPMQDAAGAQIGPAVTSRS